MQSFDLSAMTTDDLIRELWTRYDVVAFAAYVIDTDTSVIPKFEYKGNPFALDGLTMELNRRAKEFTQE